MMRPDDPIVTRVLIVDDDEEISAGLRWIIDKSEGFKCIGVYNNGADALKNLENDAPDVILMDIGLPGIDGIECTRRIKKVSPSIQILMLTVYSDEEKIFESLRAGAVGYLLKKTPPEGLLEAIREVEDGGAPMSGEVARKVLRYFKEDARRDITADLSDREADVLKELIDGHSYKAIGEKLFISPHTVRFHLHNIYGKLHVSTRAEAVAEAMKRKIPGKFP